MSDKPDLVVVIGPTAVGKTHLCIQLARRIGGEIISADSRYFYRGMDIGTAKPTRDEREGVPHHLIDILNPDEKMSLALYLAQANEAINDVISRDRIPILVGGTGQFISAIIHGWDLPKGEPDTRLREELGIIAEKIGKQELFQWLNRVDPEAAKIIDPTNTRRTIRAIEVILSSGERFSSQRRAADPLYNSLIVGITRPRDALYQQIDQRIDDMIKVGLEAEVRALLEKGYAADLPAFSAIGYAEMIAHINGAIPLDEAVRIMKKRTRNLVRRQSNWFKLDDPAIRWFQYTAEAMGDIEAYLRERLF
ncbi:MAG: tRNA (adenosine(37)-N6)-dimethylallyltransferase MiaA [Anaerolineae bacterium]|jgi:tRNA dimethylallyltransferase|nr:tRNA (adenosine(37)-N6)-dimethylallyltransferase MiaA [Anaerolineae bacterium]